MSDWSDCEYDEDEWGGIVDFEIECMQPRKKRIVAMSPTKFLIEIREAEKREEMEENRLRRQIENGVDFSV